MVGKGANEIVDYFLCFASIRCTDMPSARSPQASQRLTLKTSSDEPYRIALSSLQTGLTVTAEPNSVNMLFVSGTSMASRFAMTVELKPRAALTVVFVCTAKKPTHIEQWATVKAGAKLHLINVTLVSCRHEVVSEVMGARSESRIDWIVHATGRMECVLSAKNLFRARDGRGDLTIRGVAEDHAKIVCNGDVSIGPKAAGTQAHLVEKILVLDPTARADAIPSLDVQTHDVQASHSASVSRIHPEDLFYFASRGITAKKARKLVIDGFLRDALAAIPAGACRALVERI